MDTAFLQARILHAEHLRVLDRRVDARLPDGFLLPGINRDIGVVGPVEHKAAENASVFTVFLEMVVILVFFCGIHILLN